MEIKIYKCKHCGQIIMKVKDTGIPVICCGEPMELVQAGVTDGAAEKHVPVYTVDSDTVHVKVGSEPHPMGEDHYIQWILIKTKEGNQMKALEPTDKPETCFKITKGDVVEKVFEYCNLHGLWEG